MGEKIWELIVEGFTDILMLTTDLVTAPIMAVCRVMSDFIHGEGRYKHPDRDSRRAH